MRSDAVFATIKKAIQADVFTQETDRGGYLLFAPKITIRELFKLVDEEIAWYTSQGEEAEKKGDLSKVDYCRGAIDALNFIKRDLGFPKKLI